MNGSENDKKSSFDDAWQKAMEGAEFTPSDKVWDNISGQLPSRKKPFIWYYRAAAALLLLLLALGGTWMAFDQFGLPSAKISKNDLVPENVSPSPFPSSPLELSEDPSDPENVKAALENIEKVPLRNGRFPNPDNSQNKAKALETDYREYLDETLLEGFPALLTWAPYKFDELNSLKKIKLPRYKKPRFKPEFYVQGYGGSGYFEPNFDLRTVSEFSRSYQIYSQVYQSLASSGQMQIEPAPDILSDNLDEQNTRLGTSYTYGFHSGMRFSKNLILETGLDYYSFSLISRSNLVISDVNSDTRFPLTVNTITDERYGRAASISFVSPYELESRFDFLSVPLQLGIRLGTERLHLILKGGASADFFLKNRLTADNAELEPIEFKTDEGSPYKPVYFNGIVGGEMAFSVTDRHYVGIESSYRFGLSSFSNSDALFDSDPKSIRAGIVFRYFLNKNVFPLSL